MTIECSQKMDSSAQICKARNYVDVSDNRGLEDFLDHLSDTPTTRPSMSLPSTINRFHILLKKTKPSILLDLGIERNTTSLQPLGDRRTLPSTTSMAPLNTSLHLLKLGLEVLDPMNDKRMQPHPPEWKRLTQHGYSPNPCSSDHVPKSISAPIP